MSSDTGAGDATAHPSDQPGSSPPSHLVVGHISKAHGTKGELLVWPLTDHVDHIFAAGNSLLLGNDEGALIPGAPSVVVQAARPFKRGMLVRLDAIDTREQADALARRYLLVPADSVAPRDAGELFYHELLGMTVDTVHGRHVGRVREVYEAVPSDLLEIVDTNGVVRLVPFSERIIREADREQRRLVIDPPEGLLDL